MPDVYPRLALCEDKLSLGLLGAGGDSLASEERHTSPKVSAAFLRLVSKATCCLAHVLYAVKHFLAHLWGSLSVLPLKDWTNDRGVINFVLHQRFP